MELYKSDRTEIHVGAMNYGYDIDGIIGTDFLIATRAITNLASLEPYRVRR